MKMSVRTQHIVYSLTLLFSGIVAALMYSLATLLVGSEILGWLLMGLFVAYVIILVLMLSFPNEMMKIFKRRGSA